MAGSGSALFFEVGTDQGVDDVGCILTELPEGHGQTLRDLLEKWIGVWDSHVIWRKAPVLVREGRGPSDLSLDKLRPPFTWPLDPMLSSALSSNRYQASGSLGSFTMSLVAAIQAMCLLVHLGR